MGLVTGVQGWLPVPVVYGLGWLVLGLLFWRSLTWVGRIAGGVLALLWAAGMDGAVDPTAVGVAIGLAAYFIPTGPVRWVGACLTPLPFLAVWLLDTLGRAVAAWGSRALANFPGARHLMSGTFPWLGWFGLSLGGALTALGVGGLGPAVPAGAGAFVVTGIARRVWGADVLRPVVLGSFVWAVLRWVDAGRAAGYTAVWLAWCMGWAVPLWLYGAWQGWPWESRRRAVFWAVVLAAFGWAWVGYWRGNLCPSTEAVRRASEEWAPREWYGLQVLPAETWRAGAGQAGQVGPPGPPGPAVASSPGRTCWSVPWTAGQALSTVWEVFRQKPCDPAAMWDIDFQVVTPVGVQTGTTRRVPVCVWPLMNRTRWAFTAAFPTYLTAAARSVRICSRTDPTPTGEPLEVRLIEARPVPPLLVVEHLRVRRLGSHRYGLDVALWNPGPRRFWGYVLVGFVSADPGRASFRWLGVRRFPATIGPGDRLRQSAEVTTARFCGLPQVGIQVFETERSAQGFAWARLNPLGGTGRGPLPPGGLPMCGPSPPASEPKSLQSTAPASCPHTEP